MKQIKCAVSYIVAILIVAVLFEFDGIALEHAACYGLIYRGIVWALMLVLVLFAWENVKGSFVGEVV